MELNILLQDYDEFVETIILIFNDPSVQEGIKVSWKRSINRACQLVNNSCKSQILLGIKKDQRLNIIECSHSSAGNLRPGCH